MDKKTDPRSIRFDASIELKIEQICLAERKDWAEIVRLLVNYGLHQYDFIQKFLTIAPRYHNE